MPPRAARGTLRAMPSLLVRIVLLAGSAPIAGTVAVGREPPVAFAGWVELTGALARAHELAASAPGERPLELLAPADTQLAEDL